MTEAGARLARTVWPVEAGRGLKESYCWQRPATAFGVVQLRLGGAMPVDISWRLRNETRIDGSLKARIVESIQQLPSRASNYEHRARSSVNFHSIAASISQRRMGAFKNSPGSTRT